MNMIPVYYGSGRVVGQITLDQDFIDLLVMDTPQLELAYNYRVDKDSGPIIYSFALVPPLRMIEEKS